MDTPDDTLEVEVVYATPLRQRVYRARVPRGATVRMAIESCGILRDEPQLDPDAHVVGIFGERAGHDDEVADGDRVEIYRPLVADAKESRRRRAAKRRSRC